MKIHKPIDPLPQRQKAYPAIGDQLDAIIKCLSHIKGQGIDLGPDGDQLLADIDAVKNKFKKKKK